jgi:uncharacterized protein
VIPTVALDSRLLDILCCPVSKQPLKKLSAPRLQRVNAAITVGGLRDQAGTQIAMPLTSALLTDDGRMIYPIVEDIPVLLPEAGIATTQLDLGP